MLGKMHRIEVLPNLTYRVPPDNPFVGKKGARGEVWAYGFRNPWRFSFDRKTGDLWISDVGRDHKEEINFEPAAAEGRTELRLALHGRHAPVRGRREAEGRDRRRCTTTTTTGRRVR